VRLPLAALVGVALNAAAAPFCAAGERVDAAASVVAAVPMSRLGARLPRASLTELDLNVLWAQYRPADTVPADEEGSAIVVALPLGSPESANQDIAKQYGLAFIDSRELTALGLRLVRYRVDDGRTAADVVANLLKDPRVERAQVSVAYRTPAPPAAAADVASGAPAEPPAPAKTGAGRPAERVKGAVRVVQAPKAHAPARVVRQAAAQQPAEGRLDAGDILSGGL
jgi:hypothetical protein